MLIYILYIYKFTTDYNETNYIKFISLGVGQVLSFYGNLSHSGDPITSGIRYILAVFAYGAPHSNVSSSHMLPISNNSKVEVVPSSVQSTLRETFDLNKKRKEMSTSTSIDTDKSPSSFKFSFGLNE